ncbi:MAG: DUF6504 family protein [Phycisphaerae bacterium]|jgi:hypothetical protein
MEDFISEPLTAHPGTFDPQAMAAGLPGLPAGFDWRGESYEVLAELERWKQSGTEGGRPEGERYLRRHYYRLHMSDGTTWTVYFIRQTPRSGSPRQRWFLYSIDH